MVFEEVLAGLEQAVEMLAEDAALLDGLALLNVDGQLFLASALCHKFVKIHASAQDGVLRSIMLADRDNLIDRAYIFS